MALPLLSGEFRAGSEPELRFLPNGTAVANVSIIADARRQKDNGEWETVNETGWLRCNFWENMAERAVDEITKGSKVHVTGKFKVRKYTDREGAEKSSNELDVVAYMVIPDKPREQARQPATASGTDDNWGTTPRGSDEPPF